MPQSFIIFIGDVLKKNAHGMTFHVTFSWDLGQIAIPGKELIDVIACRDARMETKVIQLDMDAFSGFKLHVFSIIPFTQVLPCGMSVSCGLNFLNQMVTSFINPSHHELREYNLVVSWVVFRVLFTVKDELVTTATESANGPTFPFLPIVRVTCEVVDLLSS